MHRDETDHLQKRSLFSNDSMKWVYFSELSMCNGIPSQIEATGDDDLQVGIGSPQLSSQGSENSTKRSRRRRTISIA
jgi:hypothetical protein